MCPKPRIPFFWFTSIGVQKRPVLVEVLAPTRLALRGSHVRRQYRKWTTLRSKSSTIKGLLYAHWRSHCKAFVATKAHTIAMSKREEAVIWQVTINLFTSLDIPWWFHTRAVLRSLAKPYSCKKVSAWGFLWERKVWIVFSPTDVHSRNLRIKAEKGKFTCSEASTRFPQVSCFEKPTHSVPETWERMYIVLARNANGTRNGTRNWIPVQPRKARRNKKVATKIRETCEKTLFTPPSPIKAANSIVSV